MPVNITVEEGMTTNLSCTATGASTINYEWRKGDNSSVLNNNSSDRVTITTDGTLMFDEVEVDDEDFYYCLAMDSNNTIITSQPAYLTGMLSLCYSFSDQ